MNNVELINVLKEIATHLDSIGWILLFGFIAIVLFCGE